MREQGKKNEV